MTPLLLWTSLITAQASIPDLYGLGAANVGRAGASTALADDAWASYYNPAGMAQIGRIDLEIGWIGGQYDLTPFTDIVYDRNGDGETTDPNGFAEVGPVGTDYRVRGDGTVRGMGVDGFQFALSYPIGWRFAVGLSAFLPREGLLRLQMQDPQIPYYVMYRNRNNRFSIHPALSVQLIEGLSLGVGAQVAGKAVISAKAAVSVDMTAFPSDADGTEIQADVDLAIQGFEAAVKPAVQPVLGLQLALGAFVPRSDSKLRDALNRVKIGASYRGPWGVKTLADISATVDGNVTFDDDTVVLGTLLENPIRVRIDDLVAFFNPAQVSVGVSGGWGPVQASVDATWTEWSRFTELALPATAVQVDAIAGVSASVNLGKPLPPPAFKDTWTLRAGLDGTIPLVRHSEAVGHVALRVRGGYAWVPSPVPDQTGLTNYMDSNRNVGALGAGVEFGCARGFSKGPIRFDVGSQIHALERRTVTKDPGLPTDADGDGRIEYPSGYPLQGEITSAGRTWAIQGTVQFQFGSFFRDQPDPACGEPKPRRKR